MKTLKTNFKKQYRRWPLFLLVLAMPYMVQAQTFYISTSGNNTTGDGSRDNPWNSLSYACSRVKTPGDIIYINAGTYTDNNTCNLAVGVSVQGAGKNLVTINSYIGNWYIKAVSDSFIEGNQSISGFTLNGGNSPDDRKLKSAIYVSKRHNVSIHDMRFQNILNNGHTGAIYFYGSVSSWDLDNKVPPNQWLKGCSFYNNEVYNCSNRPSNNPDGNNGAIRLTGVENIKIYNNVFNESQTAGQCIKGVVGWLKGAKIYNNTFRVADNSIERRWNLGIELWNVCGDTEINNNKFYNGWCSFVSGQKLDGTYSLYFHDNEIYNAHLNEFSVNDCLIEKNYFEGYQSDDFWAGGGIDLWQTWASSKSTIKNWTARNNVFYNSKHAAIYITDKKKGNVTFENINIYNNVIDGVQGNGVQILGVSGSNYNNFNIKNNIILNYRNKSISKNIVIRNYNVSHNFLDANNPQLNYSGNRPVPYYRASRPTSNIVDAGTDVGIPYAGSAPDIGAYEYKEAVQDITLQPTGDTYININGNNYSTDTTLNTFTWPTNSIANATILQFDISAIPPGAEIQKAILHLYQVKSRHEEAGYDVGVHKIINHNPVLSKATGNVYDGINLWTPYSGLYNDIPLAQADIAAAETTNSLDPTNGYKTWGITNMVQDWINNPLSNYGVLVNSDATAVSGAHRFFASMEASDVNQHPKLEVTYTIESEKKETMQIAEISLVNNPEIKLYPNPTSTTFTITGKGTAQIEVYTFAGEKIHQTTNTTLPYQVDMSAYQPGMYIVKVMDGNEKVIKRIVKQ